MKKTMPNQKRNAFTLAEIAIAMVLMSMVVFLAGALLNLGSIGFTGSEMQMTLVREDSAFASKLNKAIQESTLSYTVPRNSFNDVNKLTAGWNYMGLMDDVHIPAFASRTGKEIDKAQALVYIEYVGTNPPNSTPPDCNLIHNADGYFVQKILGHAFTDHMGIEHSYHFELKPTDPLNWAAQTITYEFKSDVTNKAGESVGSSLDIAPMLACLNAIQVVYKGSPSPEGGSSTNPAVALAFRNDFVPTWADQKIIKEYPPATLVMILDTSGSMTSRFSKELKRYQALQKAAVSLVESNSQNEKFNIILVPFSECSACYNQGQYFFNLGKQKQACINRINRLSFNYGTNVGDGMRFAYFELERAYERNENVGTVFLMILTDGAMNAYSRGNGPGGFCIGKGVNSGTNTARNTTYARQYAKYWGEKWVADYDIAKTYLISMTQEGDTQGSGMSTADKNLLTGIFGTGVTDVTNLTDLQDLFDEIGSSIDETIWELFAGPKL